MKKDNILPDMSPVAEGLLRIHKVISRGLKISIEKCNEHPGKNGMTSGEMEGFLKYILTLKRIINSHHLSEDEIAFPYFRNYIEAPYDRLKDDHNTVIKILDRFDKCLEELPSNGAGSLLEALDELNKLWESHIKIEEENFSAEKLQQVIGMKEQLNLTEKLSDHGMKNSGPGPLTLPFLLYNLEVKDRETIMMSLPWFVKKVLVPIIWRKQWKSMSPFLLNQ